MIETSKYSDLNIATKSKLANYIHGEFGHISIVNETEWAKPDWTIILYLNNEIATFYNIVERQILVDNKEVKVAGINNVITPKKFRGNGYASRILKETESLIFDDLKSEFGMLLCADSLISFYERLNWKNIVDCPVYFEQPAGKKRVVIYVSVYHGFIFVFMNCNVVRLGNRAC